MLDGDCQKKAICELYRDETGVLGGFSARARTGLDLMDALAYVALPDMVVNTVDELKVKYRNELVLAA